MLGGGDGSAGHSGGHSTRQRLLSMLSYFSSSSSCSTVDTSEGEQDLSEEEMAEMAVAVPPHVTNSSIDLQHLLFDTSISL